MVNLKKWIFARLFVFVPRITQQIPLSVKTLKLVSYSLNYCSGQQLNKIKIIEEFPNLYKYYLNIISTPLIIC